jgi:hypothetical protein
MELFWFVFLSLALLWAADSVVARFRRRPPWAEDDRQPVQVRQARLIDKEQQLWLSRLSPQGDWDASDTYRATFELADGRERLSFAVSEDVFVSLDEAEVGELTYQGTRFLAFGRGEGEQD